MTSNITPAFGIDQLFIVIESNNRIFGHRTHPTRELTLTNVWPIFFDIIGKSIRSGLLNAFNVKFKPFAYSM